MQRPISCLIANAVPVNGGDAALLFALYEGLLERGVAVKVASYHFQTTQSLYPELPLTPEGVQGWIYRKLPPLRFLMERFTPRMRPAYRNADIVLGCPGGYFNSYYGIRGHVLKLRTAARMGKKVGVYSQSFGPLEGSDLALFKAQKHHLGLLLARDAHSEQSLAEWQVDPQQVLRTNDAAFLLKPLPPLPANGTVAISVRRWSHDARSADQFKQLILSLAREVHEAGRKVHFLSTCQGVPGYVDDSALAAEFAEELAQEGIAATVDREFHRMQDLREQLRSFDYVIGTRLHFCILALMSGTPALNISYERKGKECYDYLGMLEFSIDYNAPVEIGNAAHQALVDQLDGVRQRVVSAVDRQHRQAHTYLDQALALLTGSPK